RAVLADDIGVAVFTQLLTDRGHLLTEQQVALGLLHAGRDLVADLARELELTQRFTRPLDDARQARLGVDGLEQLDLALDREVGPPAGGIRQRAGVRHAAQRLGETARAQVLGDRADHRAVLARELAGALGDVA